MIKNNGWISPSVHLSPLLQMNAYRRQGKPEGFCLPCKGRWVAARQAGGIFLKKIDFKKKVLRFLIPQSSAMTAPFTREPKQSLSHLRWQLPFQGSLNNPSVCSRCSQPAPDGRESPLSLRDISPHCGESPYLREPKQSLSHLRWQLPLQGSLNNPSVICDDSSLYKGAWTIPQSPAVTAPFTREPV